jgi:hypothetical protein
MKTIMKRTLLTSVCAMGVLILLTRGFAHGLLSPRGLGIALLTVCVGIGIWAVLIIRKTAAELRATSVPAGASIDEATRKRRLLSIRAGQLAIVILALSLLIGLRQIRTAPLLPLVVGAAVNLCIMAVVIRIVVRLQRSVN